MKNSPYEVKMLYDRQNEASQNQNRFLLKSNCRKYNIDPASEINCNKLSRFLSSRKDDMMKCTRGVPRILSTREVSKIHGKAQIRASQTIETSRMNHMRNS